MDPNQASEPHGPRTAPFYPVPPRHLVSVEHPAIIKDVDKAIDTLQGNAGISKILNPPKADTSANLLLRPEDAMSRPLQSTSSASSNVLLKVTVPKRTGRKRKKGSDEPFSGVPVTTVHREPQRPGAKYLARTLRDNVGRYQVEPVGTINRTHVFRGMPDFVFSTTASEFSNRFREKILSFDYDKMREWDLDMSKGAISNVDIIPPPSFSHGDVPFSYIYHQNPTVRQTVDTSGNITTVNTQTASKIMTFLVSYDIPTVPSGPRDTLPPIATLDKGLQETITIVESLFQDRPAWTRRGLRNHITSPEQRYLLRHAIPYVGYIFRSGPWRDAIIKFGHDPRTSPSYRIYQTVMFRLIPREPEIARDAGHGRRHTFSRPNDNTPTSSTDPITTPSSSSHIFTGTLPLHVDGRIWMACDITDPLIHSILFPPSPAPDFLRATCDPVADGWFGNGTLAKAKTIMRNKIIALLNGTVPDDADFAKIAAFPDHGDLEDLVAKFAVNPKEASPRELALATEVRSMLKGSASWKEKTREAEEMGREMRESAGGSGEGGGEGSSGRRVRWQDESVGPGEEDEESQGEEEAIEQEEMLEAQAAAAAESVNAAIGEQEPQDEEQEDDDDKMEVEDETERRKAKGKGRQL
ncbi:putative RNA polymerase III transcription factor subunit [Aspergillus steynii IBT 23096]|uniref:Putative RNA polymerase III transcription factor subunit n=1 Tax=Aspergillus steynii IBT 23096 TaxID=1392250 RepID=A0A2I2GGN7_9EURO|nr:putative RNA polymerase III transcription factor subunit [Aspergillus steynii IBT 23096]PLB52038.1 putative RNA polymerase III transcription factor subunit [Aspergillus steynii IBT 23096]